MLDVATDQRTKNDIIPKPDSNTEVIFESVSRNPYDLSYACLMIPRFPNHYLIGDLADDLYDWMKQIFIAFGWRLDYLSVRPNHLEWIIRVAPTVSPAYFMSVIRRQTSQEILDNFPRIKKENRSKDFWALGYLVIVSTSPLPEKMVKDFVQLTRQHQGIPTDRD